MNRFELTDYILDFWLNWGTPEYEGTNEQLYDEIYRNLMTLDGIEKELDIVRSEFESGWDEKSKEYQDLCNLWDELNYYKTSLQKEVLENGNN